MAKGLDDRSRDRDGTIREKRSDTKVRTLREEYGERFAPGVRKDAKLRTVKHRENAATLNDLLRKFGIRDKTKR
jgi:hypothetical protein